MRNKLNFIGLILRTLSVTFGPFLSSAAWVLTSVKPKIRPTKRLELSFFMLSRTLLNREKEGEPERKELRRDTSRNFNETCLEISLSVK